PHSSPSGSSSTAGTAIAGLACGPPRPSSRPRNGRAALLHLARDRRRRRRDPDLPLAHLVHGPVRGAIVNEQQLLAVVNGVRARLTRRRLAIAGAVLLAVAIAIAIFLYRPVPSLPASNVDRATAAEAAKRSAA